MTPARHFSTNPKFNDRLRQGGLYVAVAALLATHTQCTNSGGGGDWEAVTTYEVTKGVQTTLEEVEPDKFEVVDEQLLLIGDAAGAPDPITGDGMSLAFTS